MMSSPEPEDAAPANSGSAPRLRDRAKTEARLRAAVASVLVKGGFGALSPSAVAREAGVDKMLIYRYFGDLPGLVRKVADAEDFFPTLETLKGGLTTPELLAMPVSRRAALVLERNVRALVERPAVLEVMVWELVERNALTAIMEDARERLGLLVMFELFSDVQDREMLRAISALLSAGFTYLALRARKIRWYAGVDLKAEAVWSDLAGAVAAMTAFLDAPARAEAWGDPEMRLSPKEV